MLTSDFWWKLYLKVFSRMGIREKMVTGFLIIFLGPVATLALIAYLFSPSAFFVAMPVVSGVVLYFIWVFSKNMSRSLLALTEYAQRLRAGEFVAPDLGPADREVDLLKDTLSDLVGSLMKEKERLEAVLENLGEALYVTDENLMVTHFNQAASELLGYSKEEIVGKKHCYEFTFYSENSKCHTDECSSIRVLRGEIPKEHREVSLIARDGTEFPAIITTSPLYSNGTGKIVGAVKLVRDLRDLKTVQKYAAELEEANRLKDLFTDVLHHDLMNPAGSVSTSLELALDSPMDKETRLLLKTAKNSMDILISIIDNASKLSRITESEVGERREIDILGEFKDAEYNMEPDIRKKGAEVIYEVDGDTRIQGNPLIYDICSNLLSNAIKYGPDGGKVRVKITGEDDAVLIAVADNGPGVPDKYKETIFQRYQRRAKEGVKGTGLGLAIVKRIVEVHKGKVWVEDNPEGGSIFLVRLPRGR
jgi:PAS domain S-box-containing protein